MSKKNRIRMNNLTRGGQATMNNVHMWTQITKILSSSFLATAFVVWLFSAFLMIHGSELSGAWVYQFAKLKSHFESLSTLYTFTWAGTQYEHTIGFVLNNIYFAAMYEAVLESLFYSFIIGCVAAIPVTWLIHRYFIKQGKALSEDKFIRGMRLGTPKELEKALKKSHKQSELSFDNHRLFLKGFEVQHMLLDGTTGAGKSAALRKLLMWIRRRGDKAIIYDKGCSYVGKFYQSEHDHLMNPFDTRCVNWDLWSDAHEDTDLENMASALIPMHGEGDPFWVHAARSIFASTALRMKEDGDRSIAKFLEVVLKSKLENLSQYLEGTESESLVSDKIQKTAISIKSVLATYIKSLRFLEGLNKDKDGKERAGFSIKDWVTNEDENGWLFISSNAQQHASLRPLISMWLAIASTSILGLEENYDRRIWVIVDEAPSLHKLPELPETIAEVRKFGGCYVLGIQSVAQLRKVYGLNAANEIFDLLNTRLFFRSPSNEMAKITSDELGTEDVDVCKDNRSVGPNSIRDGVTFGFQTVTRPIVTASEIMQTPDLAFYLRTPGEYPVCRFDMEFDQLPSINRAFSKRNMGGISKIKELEALAAHYQLGTLDSLSSEDRRKLFAIQDGTYIDSKDKGSALESMKNAVSSVNSKKPTPRTDGEEKSVNQTNKKTTQTVRVKTIPDQGVVTEPQAIDPTGVEESGLKSLQLSTE